MSPSRESNPSPTGEDFGRSENSDFMARPCFLPDAQIQHLRMESEKLLQMEEAVRIQRAHVIDLSNAYRETVSYHEGNKENVMAAKCDGGSSDGAEMMDAAEGTTSEAGPGKSEEGRSLQNTFAEKLSGKIS